MAACTEEQQKSFRDLLAVLLLALVLLFVVLLFEFRTFSAPIAILFSALLSTFGGFLALLITQTTFNVASFMVLASSPKTESCSSMPIKSFAHWASLRKNR